MSLRTSAGSALGVISLRIAAKGLAMKSVLTSERQDRPSVGSPPARASRVTFSSNALWADERGNIRRRSNRKPINEASASSIVIGAIISNFDIDNLANDENTHDHQDRTKIDDVYACRIGEEHFLVIPVDGTD